MTPLSSYVIVFVSHQNLLLTAFGSERRQYDA